MKRISALKRIIAKTIITLIIFAALAGLGYALYSMGGWVGLGIVVGGVSIFCALSWALSVLEIKGDEGPH